MLKFIKYLLLFIVHFGIFVALYKGAVWFYKLTHVTTPFYDTFTNYSTIIMPALVAALFTYLRYLEEK